MDELEQLKEQVKEAHRVIMLYRRWEHAEDAAGATGDEADTSDMLIEASFAAQDFVEKWTLKSLMPTVEEAIQMAEDYPPPADWYDGE